MKWTKREADLANELLNRCASEREFMEVLGRTKNCAKAKLDRARFRDSLGRRAPTKPLDTIPSKLLHDREMRLREARDLTAILMGDPVSSLSALTSRQSA